MRFVREKVSAAEESHSVRKQLATCKKANKKGDKAIRIDVLELRVTFN